MNDPISEARLQAISAMTIAYFNILPYGDDERGWNDPNVSSFERFFEKVRAARRAIRVVKDSLLKTKSGNLPVRSGDYSAETFHHVAIGFADTVAWAALEWLGTWEGVESGIDLLTFQEHWGNIKASLGSIDRDIDLAEVKAGINLESEAMRNDDQQWLTLQQVALGFGWFTGEDDRPHSVKVGRLANKGELRDNGKTGKDRRISRASVDAYRLKTGAPWDELDAFS